MGPAHLRGRQIPSRARPERPGTGGGWGAEGLVGARDAKAPDLLKRSPLCLGPSRPPSLPAGQSPPFTWHPAPQTSLDAHSLSAGSKALPSSGFAHVVPAPNTESSPVLRAPLLFPPRHQSLTLELGPGSSGAISSLPVQGSPAPGPSQTLAPSPAGP